MSVSEVWERDFVQVLLRIYNHQFKRHARENKNIYIYVQQTNCLADLSKLRVQRRVYSGSRDGCGETCILGLDVLERS